MDVSFALLGSGKVSVPGGGTTRHSFIAINDVAEYLVRSLCNPSARNKIVEVGGPEPLSFLDVVKIYEKLGGKLRVSSKPAFVFRTMSVLMSALNPAFANIMALHYLAATGDGIVPHACETASEFAFQLTTAEQFFSAKMRTSSGG